MAARSIAGLSISSPSTAGRRRPFRNAIVPTFRILCCTRNPAAGGRLKVLMEGREGGLNFARAQPHSHVHGVNMRFDALLPPTQNSLYNRSRSEKVIAP